MAKKISRNKKSKDSGNPEGSLFFRNTHQAGNASTFINASDLLIQPQISKLDLVFSGKIPFEIDNFPLITTIKTIENLPDYNVVEFEKNQVKESYLHFLSEVKRLEKEHCGRFQEKHRISDYILNRRGVKSKKKEIETDALSLQNGYELLFLKEAFTHGEDYLFSPYPIMSIPLVKILESVGEKDFNEIFCVLIWEIEEYVCGSWQNYLLKRKEWIQESEMDNYEGSDEQEKKGHIEECLKEIKEIDEHIAEICANHPNLITKHSRKRVEKAWTDLGNLFMGMNETEKYSDRGHIISAFFNLFSVRKNLECIDNYSVIGSDSDETLPYTHMIFFCWSYNETWLSEELDQLNEFVGNYWPTNPKRVFNLSTREKIQPFDTTFTSAVSQFYYQIANAI